MRKGIGRGPKADTAWGKVSYVWPQHRFVAGLRRR